MHPTRASRVALAPSVRRSSKRSSTAAPSPVAFIPAPAHAAWSPLSTYLTTWQKPESGTAGGEGDGHLRCFVAATGARVAAFPMKRLTPMAWPALQWTVDEALVMHMNANEVRVYEGAELGGKWIGKVSAPGLASMSVSPSAQLPVKVATFVPEAKGKPASVRVHQFPAVEGAPPAASKTFYNAQDVTMDWSPNGLAVLVKTHTDVDKTGASYYGSTGLYLLHADGSFDGQVPMQKEGPISDAKWAPTSRGFVVITGTMPAAATLYDTMAKPVFNFGQAHRSVGSHSLPLGPLCLSLGWLLAVSVFRRLTMQPGRGVCGIWCVPVTALLVVVVVVLW